jgi:hypothetical protein
MSAFSKSTECFEARWEAEHVNYCANLIKPALGRSAHALLEAAIGTRLILPPLDQFTFLKMLEAVGQGGMGNTSRLSQILVFAQTQRQVAQDQNSPAITDGIEEQAIPSKLFERICVDLRITLITRVNSPGPLSKARPFSCKNSLALSLLLLELKNTNANHFRQFIIRT